MTTKNARKKPKSKKGTGSRQLRQKAARKRAVYPEPGLYSVAVGGRTGKPRETVSFVETNPKLNRAQIDDIVVEITEYLMRSGCRGGIFQMSEKDIPYEALQAWHDNDVEKQDYGVVRIVAGRFKGFLGYYDDDEEGSAVVCLRGIGNSPICLLPRAHLAQATAAEKKQFFEAFPTNIPPQGERQLDVRRGDEPPQLVPKGEEPPDPIW